MPGSYLLHEGTVNSAVRRKPKNPRQHAAFSMTVSAVGALSQEPNILRRIAGVIGSRGREVTPFST